MFSTWTSATAVLRRIGIALMLIAVVVLMSVGLAYAQAAPADARTTTTTIMRAMPIRRNTAVAEVHVENMLEPPCR